MPIGPVIALQGRVPSAMANSVANSRVLLAGTARQRAQSSTIKPLLLGALIGALVTQAFHSLFLQSRWGKPDGSEIPFEDPYAMLGTVEGSLGVAGDAEELAKTVGLEEVMPHSNTVRGRNGVLCTECEAALASKEANAARLVVQLKECMTENRELLERVDLGNNDDGRDGRDNTGNAPNALTTDSEDNGVERKEIEVFVGIQSGFSPDAKPGDDYNYEHRRTVIRETWFRSGDRTFMDTLDEVGIVVKFVIGQGTGEASQTMIEMEQQKHKDIMMLDVEEDYHNLVTKSREFFRKVMASYSPKYIVKVDDDVYLQLPRLTAAVKQWDSMHVDYTGCMKRGEVHMDPHLKWFEPQHALLGREYFSHTWGSLYVLSGRAADAISSISPSLLRRFGNEDVTIGLYMLATDMQHYDDRRLCMSSCEGGGIGLYDVPWPGLKNITFRMQELRRSAACDADKSFHVEVPMVPPAIDFRLHDR